MFLSISLIIRQYFWFLMIKKDAIERPIYSVIEVVIIVCCCVVFCGEDIFADDIDKQCVATLDEKATRLGNHLNGWEIGVVLGGIKVFDVIIGEKEVCKAFIEL